MSLLTVAQAPIYGLPSGVALNLTNRIRFPSSGTPTYSASSAYGGYPASDAADGILGDANAWALAGNIVPGDWWMCSWSVPQTISRIVTVSRSSAVTMGICKLVFSDGSVVGLGHLGAASVTSYRSFYPRLVSWAKIVNVSDGSGFAGFDEVEMY